MFSKSFHYNSQDTRKWCYRCKCSTIFIVYLFTFVGSVAGSDWDYRVQGVLESGYQRWNAEQITSGQSFGNGNQWMQRYQIGIRGYYLSPNVVSYYVGTKWLQTDNKAGQWSTRNRSYDIIDLNARFFQNRNIWANTYFKRTWNEYRYGRWVLSSYDNVVGTNVFLLVRQLPNMKFNYQFSNNQSPHQRDLSVHILSLQLTKNSETSSVRAEFRDEQHQGRYMAGLHRNQNFQLNGRWEVLNRSGTLNADVDYTDYHFFQMTRFYTRYVQNYRKNDRLQLLYSFHSYEGQTSNTSSNLFEVNYRYFLTPFWYLVTRDLWFRQNVRTDTDQKTPSYYQLTNGIEYLKTVGQFKDYTRFSGQFYLDLRKNRETERMNSIRSNGAVEHRQSLREHLLMMHRVSLSAKLDERDSQYEVYLISEYANQLNYTPLENVSFQNYLILTDQSGERVKRSVENRCELSYRLMFRTTLTSGLTYQYFFEPFQDQSLHATNALQSGILRNLMFTAQTIHTYYQRNDLYSDRYLVKLEYRLRELNAIGQWESREEQGKRYSIYQLTASRSFGM